MHEQSIVDTIKIDTKDKIATKIAKDIEKIKYSVF